MIAPLRRVLVKRPDEAFVVEDPVKWHYTTRPDLEIAQQEHDALAALLRQAGAEVVYHDEPQPDRADAIYVFDPALVTDRGAIILSMGKALRQGEEASIARRLETLGVPVVDSMLAAFKTAEFAAELHHQFGWSHSKIGGYESPPTEEYAPWGMDKQYDFMDMGAWLRQGKRT